MSEPIEPASDEQVADSQQPAVDPTEWVGREVDYDNHKWTVTAADFATSGLPRRDGKPGRLQYHRVLELALERLDEQQNEVSEAAYLCIYCGLIKSSARGVAVHQKHDHAGLVPESEKPSRVHFSADFSEMTMAELRDLHRSYQAMAQKLKDAATQVAEARAAQRAAEKNLEVIRKALGLPKQPAAPVAEPVAEQN